MPPTEMIARLPSDQLGGARVFRPCNIASHQYRAGDMLTAETLASIPRAALRALVDQRFIVPWPKSPDTPLSTPDEASEAYVYNRLGTNTYDVIVGKRVNTRPLPKTEAEALAAKYKKPAAA